MKVVWETNDVQCGRRVTRCKGVEVWQIGYYYPAPGQKQHYTLNSMNDGLVSGTYETVEVMVEALNKGGYLPIELVLEDFRRHTGYPSKAAGG